MRYRLRRDLAIQTNIWVRIEQIGTNTAGYWFVPNADNFKHFVFNEYIETANAQADRYEAPTELLLEFDDWEEAMLQVPWLFL